MSLNPLNELKRILQDENKPLSKRLCLAKNVINSHHFPSAPKGSIVAAWLSSLRDQNLLEGKQFRDVIGWAYLDDLNSELKTQLVQVASQFVQNNQIQDNVVQPILSFLENDKILTHLTQNVDGYLTIVVALLNYLRVEETLNVIVVQRLLNNIVKNYKECKKKLDFIIKLLDGANLETLFSYLDTKCYDTVLNVCQTILFPMNKKSFFVSFLQTLIRKDNIDELMAEKADNIQSVLKIMSALFTFPKGRTKKDPKFVTDFINVFASCFGKESQLIFAFYIMAVNSLNMNQNYIQPAMNMPPIIFEDNDEKVKRNMFLKMLQVLVKNEVDISVKLTDTFGEKISKVEIKKNFLSFLQTVMVGQLKLEGKPDKASLQIVKVALELDPVLVEQKIDQILPPIMTAKKTDNIHEDYVNLLNCLLQIIFKLSRGITFLSQIIPNIKLSLEASNTEQFELKQKLIEAIKNEENHQKIKSKLITGIDLFPSECVEMYGKLTSELMFRQNKDFLLVMQKDFEEYCLMMLEEGFVSPSIITLAEVLSAILSSFLRHSKIADHTVPEQIAEDFWDAFQKFEMQCLRKFGECVLKLGNNPQLIEAFLNLCISVSQLKLLNIKYGHIKVAIASTTSEVFDLSFLLPCLTTEQWIAISAKVTEAKGVLLMEDLLTVKAMALQLISKPNSSQNDNDINSIKTHLIEKMNANTEIINTNVMANVLFHNLGKGQAKQLAKIFIKVHINNPDVDIIDTGAVANNRILSNALTIETIKQITKCFNNIEALTKSLNKNDFNFTNFTKDVDMTSYFDNITIKDDQKGDTSSLINILRQIPLPYLEESVQLLAIFTLLIIKKCCQKKIRKIADHILLNIYELSPKYPDLYKVFPVDFIFSFEDESFLNLLTLKIKTSNSLFIVKCILESAVKKVKTDSGVIKKIIEILLLKQKIKKDDISSIEYFSNTSFQMSCLILPIIAKEKRAITTSNYRSILANLQEELHKSLLDCFKSIDFAKNSSLFDETNGNIDESMAISDNALAALNAIAAYSLTLSKYCETTDAEELKNLDCLWSGLEFFVQNAIKTIQNPQAKNQHIESSIQLLNIILRHVKKLNSHPMFEEKDKIFIQIWKSVLARLTIIFGQDKKCIVKDDFGVALRFLCELTSVEGLSNIFIADLTAFLVLKKPCNLIKEEHNTTITSHRTYKYIWVQCLKSNTVGAKCGALSKLLTKTCKELRYWLQSSYEESVVRKRKVDDELNGDDEVKILKVDDVVCDVLRVDLDIVAEGALAAKRVTLDFKLVDSVFSLIHSILCILGSNSTVNCDVSWMSFFKLFEGCVAILNNLLMSREELLEDRWPNYMQCYRALLSCLCERASSPNVDRILEQKLAEVAHGMEKLTQSLSKRKAHVSRIAAYTVADICSLLELKSPTKMVRQHLENSAALLLQAADSSYALAFLRRGLASSPGHVTLANMYTMYKRYHKYTGNS